MSKVLKAGRRAALGAAVGAIAALMMPVERANAQAFPSKPITVVVAYAAGGPSDVTARVVADAMGRLLNATVVVENVTGAGGTSGAARVAGAEPDGHTLMVHHLALMAAPGLYNNLKYDTATAFAPLGLINSGPMLWTTRKDVPANTPAELVTWLKANNEKITAAFAGPGTMAHLCTVLMTSALGIKPTLVAYRGTGPAMNDLVGGKLDFLCDQTTTVLPQMAGGTIKTFAITSPERLGNAKDVPTVKEIGFPQAEFGVWHGLYAPKGTPPAIVAKLNETLRKALSDPAVKAKFEAFGTNVWPDAQMSPEAHAKQFAFELKRLPELLAAAGVKQAEAK